MSNKQQSLFTWLQRSPENATRITKLNESSPGGPKSDDLKSPTSKSTTKKRTPLSSPNNGHIFKTLGNKSLQTRTVSPVSLSSDDSEMENKPLQVSKDVQLPTTKKVHEKQPDVKSMFSPPNVKKTEMPVSVGDNALLQPKMTIKVSMPPVRTIDCPEGFEKGRIPDLLIVTEFLENFGSILLNKRQKKLDPEPDFHLLLAGLNHPRGQDSLFVCGIIHHLVSMAKKQSIFAKIKHFGQNVSDLDLSVQSSPEILRILMEYVSLSSKHLFPKISHELFDKWGKEGFFALSSSERLDILLSTVNWLNSCPSVVDFIAKKEEELHQIRGELLKLRKDLLKDKKLNVKSQGDQEPNAGNTETEMVKIDSKKDDDQRYAKQIAEINEMKILVEQYEKEYERVRGYLPVGVDREGTIFWRFPTFTRMSADKTLVVERRDDIDEPWGYYNIDDLFALISYLQNNPFISDFKLRCALENTVKEAQLRKEKDHDVDMEPDLLAADVDISAGIMDEVATQLLDAEARINSAAFADPLPNIEQWRDKLSKPGVEITGEHLSESLLELANSVSLRIIVEKARVSQLNENSDEREDNKGLSSALVFHENSYFAQWKKEVAKCFSGSRLYVLFDIFLNWLQWGLSAENARCKKCRRGPNHGTLILCDNAKCNRSFHLHCLNMKNVPDGDWFCPPCVEAESKTVVKEERSKKQIDYKDLSEDEISVSEFVSESEESEVDEFREPDMECRFCKEPGSAAEELIACSICYHSYHLDCLDPPLRYPPRGTWYCQVCTNAKKKKKTRRVVVDSPPERPKAKATRRTTRNSAREGAASRSSTSRQSCVSASPPPKMRELNERYSFRRTKKE